MVNKFQTMLSICVALCTVFTIILIPTAKALYNYKRSQAHLAEDYKNLQELKEMAYDDKMILLMILNHIIDGNNVEKIKETRNLLIKQTTEDFHED